jgi:hypothetical protein
MKSFFMSSSTSSPWITVVYRSMNSNFHPPSETCAESNSAVVTGALNKAHSISMSNPSPFDVEDEFLSVLTKWQNLRPLCLFCELDSPWGFSLKCCSGRQQCQRGIHLSGFSRSSLPRISGLQHSIHSEYWELLLQIHITSRMCMFIFCYDLTSLLNTPLFKDGKGPPCSSSCLDD